MTDIIAKLKQRCGRCNCDKSHHGHFETKDVGSGRCWLCMDCTLFSDDDDVLALIKAAEALELSLKSINDCDCGVIGGGTPPHINTCAFVIAEPALVKMRALREGKL